MAPELQQLLEAIPSAVYLTDADGRLTYFNRAAVEFSGRTPELGTDSWCVSWKLFNTDGTPLPHDQCPMAIAIREGRAVRGAEAIAERPDGTRIPFRPYPTPLRDAAGKVVGGINMLVDLRETRRREQEVRSGEQRYRQLLELVPAAIYTCAAPSGVITFFNGHAARLWGRTPALNDTEDRFCGSFRLWKPDGAPLPHAQTPMALAMRDGESFRNQDVVIERPDGSRISVLVNIDPMRDDAGAIVGAINVFVDNTAIKAAEQELRRAEEARGWLAAIVESSDDAIVSKTLDGVVTSWNAGAERIFGYAADEAIGRHVTLIIPQERRAEEDMVLARIRQGLKVDHFETVRRRKDGAAIEISLTVSPILDASGRVIGASKIARDITERKRAEAALREADRRKDEFIATLSHELRNPLAPIRNAIELLGSADPAVIGQARSILARQSSHMTRLIDDLLDFSRITLGTIALEKRPVPLREVAEAAIETGRPNLDAKGVALHAELPAPGLMLLADPVRISQVLANILNNAAKYTPSGGRVELTVREENGQALVSVRDTGAGIPQHLLGGVFDTFAQIDTNLKRAGGGLGIGLSLAKKLLDLHGGTIEARSEGPGRGAEFIVRLPVLPDAAARVRQAVQRAVEGNV
ncbi:MAG TPA: PAS domain S-box protein [Burkholderiales bacterium]|nr:PAS domain S-box protein [Burkholderiales bacterium]